MRGAEFAELRTFVAVAERNSFGRAAGDLGLTPSTVSQTVKSLEARLGTRLFNRTTRNVSLTGAGERLLARVRPAVMELDAAVGDLAQFHDTPSGTLLLNVSSIAAEIILAPAMQAFLSTYPAITLDVTVDDNQIDFSGGHFDASIRVGRRVARDIRMVRVSEPSGQALLSPRRQRALLSGVRILNRGGAWMTAIGERADAAHGAGPVDCDAYGDYGGHQRDTKPRPEFVRAAYPFQGRITADGSSGYPAEPGRDHLYVSLACPWAHRTVIVRKLLGLEGAISLSVVDPIRDGRGWAFRAGDGHGRAPLRGLPDTRRQPDRQRGRRLPHRDDHPRRVEDRGRSGGLRHS